MLLAEIGLRIAGHRPRVSWDYLLAGREHVAHPATLVVRRVLLEDGPYAAPADVLRLVALGDSFTLGYPVAADDAYPAVLARLLADAGRPAHVVNAGIGNSGPDQHLRLLEDVILPRYAPDVVVWTFYWNDLGDNLRLAAFDVEGGGLVALDGRTHWLYRRQRLYERIPLPPALKGRSALVATLLAAFEAAHRPRKRLGAADLAASEERIRLGLERLRARGRQDGFVVLACVVTPQAVRLHAADPERWPENVVVRHARRLEALLGETGEVVVVAPEAAGPPPLLGLFADESRRGVQLAGDYHFNEAGYRRMAETILPALLRAVDEDARGGRGRGG